MGTVSAASHHATKSGGLRRRRASPPETPPSPEQTARLASLRYVSDDTPGFTRRRTSTGFSYRDVSGKAIVDRDVTSRIAAIAIPPAWDNVWISPVANGHIQATGRDAKGRKQYCYHARWHSVRGEDKYGRMLAFGAALPAIRTRVNADLDRRDQSREKVLAVVVRLLETTFIRVGNEEYAKTNGSFGLTTLRNRHVQFSGDSLRFSFVGKMGKAHDIRITDRRLSRLVRRCRELPGQSLFQYRDEAGAVCSISSTDVNDYIREVAGDEFTAKDFRTWAGSLLAASQLPPDDRADTDQSARRGLLTAAVKAVSTQLGNTPAVCKAGYIHPRILQAFNDGDLQQRWSDSLKSTRSSSGVTREERAMLHFLSDTAQ